MFAAVVQNLCGYYTDICQALATTMQANCDVKLMHRLRFLHKVNISLVVLSALIYSWYYCNTKNLGSICLSQLEQTFSHLYNSNYDMNQDILLFKMWQPINIFLIQPHFTQPTYMMYDEKSEKDSFIQNAQPTPQLSIKAQSNPPLVSRPRILFS